jgi:hypothetical protein
MAIPQSNVPTVAAAMATEFDFACQVEGGNAISDF